MAKFSYICIMWISTFVCLLSAEHQVNVSGPVGSTAVLPCKLTSVNPKSTPKFTWVFKSNHVFERPGEKIGEGYEGRVKVPVEKKNCSLVLHDLRDTDRGVYISYQTVSDEGGRDPISIVNLSVYGKIRGDPPTPTDDAVMKSPHPLILVLSLVSCLLVQLFCVLKQDTEH